MELKPTGVPDDSTHFVAPGNSAFIKFAFALCLGMVAVGCSDSSPVKGDVDTACGIMKIGIPRVVEALASWSAIPGGYRGADQAGIRFEIALVPGGGGYTGYAKLHTDDTARYVIALDKAMPWDLFDSAKTTVKPDTEDDYDSTCPEIGTYRYYTLGKGADYYLFFGPTTQDTVKLVYHLHAKL
jgi:hypothetical protein